MLIVVCYDVAVDQGGPKRLRRIAEACKDYGVRVQYSVFECRLEDKDWVAVSLAGLPAVQGAADAAAR